MSQPSNYTLNGKNVDGKGLGGSSSSTLNASQYTSSSEHGRQAGGVALQSPCFVHSYLDNGLGNFRKDQSYFDTHQRESPMPALGFTSNFHQNEYRKPEGAQQSQGTSTQTETNTNPIEQIDGSSEVTNRSRRPSSRPEPMHRGMRGAVEPDSDDEDGSGSSASSSASTSQLDHSSYDSNEEQETRVRSLTRQLAETAVGVREMSKQLGRARVKSTIQSVMIITKARDNHLIKLTRELAIWLMTTPRNGRDSGLVVYVDSQLRTSKRFDSEGIKRDYPYLFTQSKPTNSNGNSTAPDQEHQNESVKSGNSSMNGSRIGGVSNGREESLLRYWTSDMCSRSPHLFDFVVTLGGDGTVLFCSWLFQRIVPPVMPFALGSLGFLTNFDFKDYQKVLKSALDTGIRVNLRMRFTATVYRATLPNNATVDKRRRRAIKSGKTGEIIMKTVREEGWEKIEKARDPNRSDQSDEEEPVMRSNERPKRDKEVMCFSTRPVETFEVLNDLVVDRGPSPYVSLLEVFGDEHHLTTAQADGLCISTPTGSTAYSLSAGGSLVHPEIPAILISPICPHTLSFRPMLLPDSMELRIAVPYNSRSTAWASFDGRGRVELKQGDHIKVTASRYPFPTVCAENQSIDWFESISRTLKWNERQRQKSFVVVEEGEEDQARDDQSGEKKKEKVEKQKQRKDDDQHKGANANKALVHHRSQEEDEDGEEDDDDEGEEEKYDIDDTSAAATRTNSPSGTRSSLSRRHSTTSEGRNHHHHHHHHHHHSHQHRSQSNATTSSLPNSGNSSATSLPLFGLKPMTSMSTDTATKGNSEVGSSRSAPSGKVTFDSSSNAKQKNSPSEESSVDSLESTSTTGKYQHGVVQPSNRSLLDSPDRFGLAGPPDPPRALSERHLATADFRLDDSSMPMEPKPSKASTEKEKAQDNSGEAAQPLNENGLKSPQNASALRESILKVAENKAKIASGSNKLYRKLKGNSSSSSRSRGGSSPKLTNSDIDANYQGGFELGRNDSRKSGGAALIVYGQDESDSDSTAEG